MSRVLTDYLPLLQRALDPDVPMPPDAQNTGTARYPVWVGTTFLDDFREATRFRFAVKEAYRQGDMDLLALLWEATRSWDQRQYKEQM